MKFKMKFNMRFNKEVWKWITPCILADLIWHFISLPTKYNPWAYFFVITLPTTLGIILLASFFRDPQRFPDDNYKKNKSILSPADGQLIAIDEEEGNLVMYIEMHYNNVHVIRTHLSGTVKKVIRTGGNHHLVYFIKNIDGKESKAIKKNARAIIEVENKSGDLFKLSLICGAFFRRAKPYVKVGDVISQGQRIGMIVFGSTCKFTFPGKNYKILPKLGDKVKGGKTVICELLSLNSNEKNKKKQDEK